MSLGANGGSQCGAEIWNCLQQGTSLDIRAGGTQVVFDGDLQEAEVKDVPCALKASDAGPLSAVFRASNLEKGHALQQEIGPDIGLLRCNKDGR